MQVFKLGNIIIQTVCVIKILENKTLLFDMVKLRTWYSKMSS